MSTLSKAERIAAKYNRNKARIEAAKELIWKLSEANADLLREFNLALAPGETYSTGPHRGLEVHRDA